MSAVWPSAGCISQPKNSQLNQLLQVANTYEHGPPALLSECKRWRLLTIVLMLQLVAVVAQAWRRRWRPVVLGSRSWLVWVGVLVYRGLLRRVTRSRCRRSAAAVVGDCGFALL